MALNQTKDDFANAQPVPLGQVFSVATGSNTFGKNDPFVAAEQKIYDEIYGNRTARIGLQNIEETDEEREKQEREKDQRVLSTLARDAQQISYDGMKINYSQFYQTLQQQAQIDGAMLNIVVNAPTVKDADMLRVDGNGNLVRPEDDPQGNFIVKTKEEKKAFEAKIGGGACSIYSSQDEVTLSPTGAMVKVADFNLAEQLRGSMEEKTTTAKKLESGELTLDRVDDHLKAGVAESIRGDKAALSALDLDAERKRLDPVNQAFEKYEKGELTLAQMPDELRRRVEELEKIKHEDPTMKAFGSEIGQVLKAAPGMDLAMASGPRAP